MLALAKSETGVALTERSLPASTPAGQVLLQVETVGLCRTDLWVAEGKLEAPPNLVLGHEFSAQVLEGTHRGRRVAVFPWLAGPSRPNRWSYRGRSMLGLHCDGALTERLLLPQECVLPLDCDPQRVAYAEPLTAALALLEIGLEPHQRGILLGDDRLTLLAERVLREHGYRVERRLQPEPGFDYAVEAQPQQVAQLMSCLVPGGVLVIKSRATSELRLDRRQLLCREIQVRPAYYGSFERAVELLPHFPLDDLLGPSFPLTQHRDAFAAEQADTNTKKFITVGC